MWPSDMPKLNFQFHTRVRESLLQLLWHAPVFHEILKMTVGVLQNPHHLKTLLIPKSKRMPLAFATLRLA
jgi:hypothetical protein